MKIKIEEEITEDQMKALRELSKWAIGKEDFRKLFNVNLGLLMSKGWAFTAFTDVHISNYGMKVIENSEHNLTQEQKEKTYIYSVSVETDLERYEFSKLLDRIQSELSSTEDIFIHSPKLITKFQKETPEEEQERIVQNLAEQQPGQKGKEAE